MEAGPEEVALLWLGVRAASRAVVEIASGLPADPDELGRALRELPWEEWLPEGVPWAVRARGRAPRFRHTRFAERWLKDAIRQAFAARGRVAPPVDPACPGLLVDFRLSARGAAVGIDPAAGSLHRRAGARAAPAPLREDLAAGLAWLARADRPVRLVDPFCGSGTLIAEAVAVARRRARTRSLPPALLRLPAFSAVDLDRVRSGLDARERPLPAPAIAADRDPGALRAAVELLRRAGLEEEVRVVPSPVRELRLPPEPLPTLALTNPPWGRRLAAGVEEAWRDLGRWVRRELAGGELAVLCGNARLTRYLGLRSRRRYPVVAGGITARLCVYPIGPERPRTQPGRPRAGSGAGPAVEPGSHE